MRAVTRPNHILEQSVFKQEVFRLWPLQTLRTIASSITASGDTFFLVSATTNVIITLPKASGVGGSVYSVMKVDNTANTVAVSGATATETINGSASYTINSQYVAITLLGDNVGERWVALSVRT